MKITNLGLVLRFLSFSLFILLYGCGGSSEVNNNGLEQLPDGSSPMPDTAVVKGAAVPDNRYVVAYKILIYGNSHVRSNNLPELIRQMISAGQPGVQVELTVAEGMGYLDERLHTHSDISLLKSAPWTHVILQGQKYSTTGLYSYPVTDTLVWLQEVKALQATPVLFPEHGQLHNSAEGQRVYQLHQSISMKEPACIAPVGLAWYELQQLEPQMQLHHADGNHAALAGSFLTAAVFYQSITANNADLLPFLPQINLPQAQQQQLRQVAAATLQRYPACPF